MRILDEYIEDGMVVTEYESGAIVRVPNVEPSEVPESPWIEYRPSLEDLQLQTLLNTEYLVVLAELNM